jgi:hypothetical protein
MPKPNARDIKTEKIEPRNEILFTTFKRDRGGYKPGYYQAIENFLKYSGLEGRSLDSFTTNDVKNYILALWDHEIGSARTDLIIEAICTFKNYLIERNSFPSDFLKDIRKFKVNEKSSPDTLSLTFEQLKRVRNFNKQCKSFEYLFEILFQLGIDKKDLVNCLPEYANLGTGEFIHGKKVIKFNQKIKYLLNNKFDSKDIKRIIRNIDYLYFGKVTKDLRDNNLYQRPEPRQINYSDILDTHKKYILKCPNPECNEFTENISSNWVLVKTNFEDEYRLFCSSCKGKKLQDDN